MGTVTIPPGKPEIPLTPALRGTYEAAYAAQEKAIETTADPALLESLNASQLEVAAVISLDDQAIIAQTTTSFEAVLTQIGKANASLTALKKQIEKTASDIAKYAEVLAGVTKVLSMVPAL